ncbi:MAG: efflux RND transporter periplasmic adaptor subunit, partial [Fimbriimonadaceae bacterium]|nr:efflux RND transporter periplasmic adaptor subunit [Chitinophagales bacterium]
MKRTLLYVAMIIVLASCGAKSSDETADDKQVKLDSLKNERTELDKQIKSLEEEISKAGGDSASMKSELVIIEEMQPTVFTSYIDLQAKVDADQNVTVTAQMPGAVQKIYVSEGQSVGIGSVLAELDNDAAEKQLQTLETQLSFAKDIYNKQKTLWDQKIGTEVQYLSAKNNVETLENSLAASKQQLQMSKLISPINGVVDAVDIKVGQMASPGFNGIRVVNTNSLKVIGEVSEAYSAYVQTGDKVKLFFPDLKQEVDSKISF